MTTRPTIPIVAETTVNDPSERVLTPEEREAERVRQWTKHQERKLCPRFAHEGDSSFSYSIQRMYVGLHNGRPTLVTSFTVWPYVGGASGPLKLCGLLLRPWVNGDQVGEATVSSRGLPEPKNFPLVADCNGDLVLLGTDAEMFPSCVPFIVGFVVPLDD